MISDAATNVNVLFRFLLRNKTYCRGRCIWLLIVIYCMYIKVFLPVGEEQQMTGWLLIISGN